MQVCLRFSLEALTELGLTDYCSPSLLDSRYNRTLRILCLFDEDTYSVVKRGHCVINKIPLVRVKSLKILKLLPTDEARRAYIESQGKKI